MPAKSTLPAEWENTIELGYKEIVTYAYMGHEDSCYRSPKFIGPEVGSEESN